MEEQEYRDIVYYLQKKKYPEEISKLHTSSKYRFKKKAELYSYNGSLINNLTGIEVIKKSEATSRIKKEYEEFPYGTLKIYQRLQGSGITRSTVETTMNTFRTKQLHSQLPAEKSMKHLTAKKYGERLQADLVDMSNYNWNNNGFNWILTVIDVYSRKAWAVKLKNKSAKSVTEGIEPILKSVKPNILHTDNGSEFVSKQFKTLCQKYSIKQIFGSPYSPHSQGHIERFNKTLKSLIFRHFTNCNTKIWINVLDKYVLEYNNTEHSVTKRKPISETSERDHRPDPPNTLKSLSIGQKVRISLRSNPQYRKNIFQKTYTPLWTEEIYTIQGKRPKNEYYVQKRWIKRQDLLPIETVVKNECPKIPDRGNFNREEHLRRIQVPNSEREENPIRNRPIEPPMAVTRGRRERTENRNFRDFVSW